MKEQVNSGPTPCARLSGVLGGRSLGSGDLLPQDPSLEEAGLELLTFYSYPKSMWKSLRTTNALENLNREFRRRTKTQGSFATEAGGVTLLWGLVAFGQIRLRRIDGYRDINKLLHDKAREAA